VKQRRAQFLLHATDDFGINAQVMCQPIRWDLLIESLQDGNLAPEFREDSFAVDTSGISHTRGASD
jgi:hypothetical protein